MAQISNTSATTATTGRGESQALARFERERAVMSPWRMIGRRMWSNRMGMVGLFIIVFMYLVAFAAPLIAPADPIDMTLENQFQPPSSEHLMGTDDFGRDVFSRLVHGARLSLRIGPIAVGIAFIVGGILGGISGYLGRWPDMIIQRFMDIMLSFPDLILALAIMAVLGPSLVNVMIAIGISSIPVYTRVMRGQVLSLREKEYVEAARAAGASHARLIFRHILPNTFSPLIVIASLGMAAAILAGSGLSFIGMGAQPPSPEWGAMLASGREYLRHEWWIATFPGIAIAVTVLGFNLFGDGLRDAFDPRTLE
jgi:peptide/nickel transport system permease protein